LRLEVAQEWRELSQAHIKPALASAAFLAAASCGFDCGCVTAQARRKRLVNFLASLCLNFLHEPGQRTACPLFISNAEVR